MNKNSIFLSMQSEALKLNKHHAEEVIKLMYEQKIIIHKNYNEKEHKSIEIIGFQNSKKKNATFSYFCFLESNNIETNDIFQIKDSNDLWEIVNVELKGGFLNCKCKRKKNL